MGEIDNVDMPLEEACEGALVETRRGHDLRERGCINGSSSRKDMFNRLNTLQVTSLTLTQTEHVYVNIGDFYLNLTNIYC